MIDQKSKLTIIEKSFFDGRKFYQVVGTDLFTSRESAEKAIIDLLKDQTKTHSLFETVMGSLMAAPSALLTHKFALYVTGSCATESGCQDPFIIGVWVIFLLHSIAWKWILRRLFNRFGKRSDPVFLIRSLINKLRKVE